jgi:tetratricopeptide (TPR) repeat protein
MRLGFFRVLCVLASGLWLAGCQTDKSFSDLLSAKTPASANGLDANASVPAGQPVDDTEPPPLGLTAAQEPAGVLGSKAYDDLSIGKRYYRIGNYGMAERYFRQAVETHPRDAEAWLGLAAACDRLRRFDLADRAYGEAIKLAGPTVEILNNQGYSYMLRGDYAQARAKLDQARRLDPANRYVDNNLRLLGTSARTAKAVE